MERYCPLLFSLLASEERILESESESNPASERAIDLHGAKIFRSDREMVVGDYMAVACDWRNLGIMGTDLLGFLLQAWRSRSVGIMNSSIYDGLDRATRMALMIEGVSAPNGFHVPDTDVLPSAASTT